MYSNRLLSGLRLNRVTHINPIDSIPMEYIEILGEYSDLDTRQTIRIT